ncbi:Lrp/AsnC family transcriptional regulator [Plantibacter sp. YIM 135249]|jgi:DNA-binding Lrp family transcriptional regulator|uniref:Lrp/AsnC family transcriptional regulator n=1 Tax=Plantibacter sp. YIM 135249 TaxID=3423918 RepID=UPI003D356A16
MPDLDERLLELLQQDGRASYSELAERIGISRAVVAARVNALIDTEAVRVVAAVHPEFLGLQAYAHVSIHTAGPASDTIPALVALRAAVFVSSVSGEHDLVVELRLPDQRELYATVAVIRGLPGVVAVNTLLYVDVVTGIFMPAKPLPDGLRIDRTDIELMKALQEDGRVSYRELAERVGLSPSAVRSRVTALVEQQVVRIGPVLNRRLRSAKAAAGVGINIHGEGARAIAGLRGLRGVEFIARTIGRFDLVATVSADSVLGLHDVIDSLKGLDDVVRLETWVHLEVVKERYEWPLPSRP